jgi:hypothetical protein
MNARTGLAKVAAIALGLLGCAPPDFRPDAPFTRPLSEFRKIEIRPVRVQLAPAAPTREQVEWAEQFAGEFRKALLHRLHRKGRLDAPDGPALVLDVRIVRYELEVLSGGTDSPSHADSKIEIVVTFRDEAGSKIGSGSVIATGTGSAPRFSLENSEAAAISSVHKFIRKSLGRKSEEDEPESPVPGIVPSP